MTSASYTVQTIVIISKVFTRNTTIAVQEAIKLTVAAVDRLYVIGTTCSLPGCYWFNASCWIPSDFAQGG